MNQSNRPLQAVGVPQYAPNQLSVAGRPKSSLTSRLVAVLVALGIALHFSMILIVVAHLDEWMAKTQACKPALAIISRYSIITFANRNFGFFAPSVSPDWNLQITTVTKLAERHNCRFPLPSREMEVKMYSMLGHFSEDKDTMNLFARSWAVYAMNHDLEAVKVEINVTRNYIPSMSEYRKGRRIEKRPWYRTTFELK